MTLYSAGLSLPVRPLGLDLMTDGALAELASELRVRGGHRHLQRVGQIEAELRRRAGALDLSDDRLGDLPLLPRWMFWRRSAQVQARASASH